MTRNTDTIHLSEGNVALITTVDGAVYPLALYFLNRDTNMWRGVAICGTQVSIHVDYVVDVTVPTLHRWEKFALSAEAGDSVAVVRDGGLWVADRRTPEQCNADAAARRGDDVQVVAA